MSDSDAVNVWPCTTVLTPVADRQPSMPYSLPMPYWLPYSSDSWPCLPIDLGQRLVKRWTLQCRRLSKVRGISGHHVKKYCPSLRRNTTVTQLRNISAPRFSTLLTHTPSIRILNTTGFGPSMDNYVIQHFPGHVFNSDEQMQIPLLAGWNATEKFLFLGVALPRNTVNQFESVAKILFAPRILEFLTLYP